MGKSPVQYKAGTVEPGWRTTELCQTLVTQILATIVGIIGLFKSNLNLEGIRALVPIMAVAVAVVAQIFYSISRSKVKIAAGNVTSSVPIALAIHGDSTAIRASGSSPGFDGLGRGQGIGVA